MSLFPNIDYDSLKEGWSKSADGKAVVFKNKKSGSVSAFDEAGLRKTIADYLSNDSRSRFADDGRFCDNKMFWQGLQHLNDGLKLFFEP